MKRKKQTLKFFETPIIGGKYKGKKISIPDISTTRSSKSILRESLFDTLQYDIVDAVFVEVFAGSGSVGLEAISRGAHRAIFVEKNRSVFELLQKNIEKISPDNAEAVLSDSFEYFPALLQKLKRNDKEKELYFYFDPPFSIRDGMSDIYDKTIDMIASIDNPMTRMVAVEHMSKIDLPASIGKFELKKRKRFGKSTLSYYTFN